MYIYPNPVTKSKPHALYRIDKMDLNISWHKFATKKEKIREINKFANLKVSLQKAIKLKKNYNEKKVKNPQRQFFNSFAEKPIS